MTGKFNAHLRNKCLLFADEAIVPGTEGEGALKGLITETTIPIEQKGKDVVEADNHLHVILASNHTWVIPADRDARLPVERSAVALLWITPGLLRKVCS